MFWLWGGRGEYQSWREHLAEEWCWKEKFLSQTILALETLRVPDIFQRSSKAFCAALCSSHWLVHLVSLNRIYLVTFSLYTSGWAVPFSAVPNKHNLFICGYSITQFDARSSDSTGAPSNWHALNPKAGPLHWKLNFALARWVASTDYWCLASLTFAKNSVYVS